MEPSRFDEIMDKLFALLYIGLIGLLLFIILFLGCAVFFLLGGK